MSKSDIRIDCRCWQFFLHCHWICLHVKMPRVRYRHQLNPDTINFNIGIGSEKLDQDIPKDDRWLLRTIDQFRWLGTYINVVLLSQNNSQAIIIYKTIHQWKQIIFSRLARKPVGILTSHYYDELIF